MNLDKLNLVELVKFRRQIYKKIQSYKDGFIYSVSIHSYGSISYEEHYNDQTVYELGLRYNGDNGFTIVRTDNLDFIRVYEDGMKVEYID